MQQVALKSGVRTESCLAALASSVVFSTSSNSRRMTPLSKSRWPLGTIQKMAQRQLHRCTTVCPGTMRWDTGWSRVECCRISARMSTPFSSSKFSQISGSGILVLCKNLVGISALLRHCYAGSSETQCFASNKCEPSRAPYHCASQSWNTWHSTPGKSWQRSCHESLLSRNCCTSKVVHAYASAKPSTST